MIRSGTWGAVGKIVGSTLTLALLAASVGLNVYMARRVESLTSSITALKTEGRLQVGTALPALIGEALGDGQVPIPGAGSRPTVLYVFTPTCGWCERNLDNIRSLHAAVGTRFNFVGVSLVREGLKEYVQRTNLRMPVIVADDAMRKVYKFGSTPTTIVVSSDARVEQVWLGAFQGNHVASVERYFGTKLPGLARAK